MSQDIGDKAYLSHTAQEIDDAIDALPTKAAAADLTAEVTAREQLQAAVTGLIDSGAKNILPVNSGSNSTWLNLSATAKSGDYILYIGHLESTDTDSETCQIAFLDSGGNTVGAYKQMARGDGVYTAITLTSDNLATVRIYSSDSYAHSSGDTVSFTEAMLCTAEDWAISQKYVPYCPTLPELYQMVLDLGGGNRSMSAAPTEQEEQR